MSFIDQDLGERDNEGPDDYPSEERKIYTQGYDLSIKTLVEQWQDSTLVIPNFQREYVWDNAKASRLIESLLLNIPIPVLFFAETERATHEIVDGHQRVFSVVRYMDNQFPLSGLRISQEFKGKRFHQLPDREQRFLQTRVMRAIVIGVDSSPTMKFEVFERLNTGGLALNAQEIRNAIFHGSFNEQLKALETVQHFRDSLGTKRPRKRMVDRELILRFFALRDRFSDYRTPLVRFLNDYMRDMREPESTWLDDRRDVFEKTVALVAHVLGESAYRITDVRGNPAEKNVNRAVFDAQMLAFSVADAQAAQSNQSALRSQLAQLFQRESFENSIRRATGDKARLHQRLKEVLSAFESANVRVDRSFFTGLR